MPCFRNDPFIKRALRAASVFAFAGWLAGCAHTYDVKVTALRSPEVAPCRTYRLVSAVEGREAYDPQFPRVAAWVEDALAARGMFAASRPEWADVEVRVDFGVGLWRLKAVPDGDEGAAAMVFTPASGAGPVSESTGTLVPASALRRVVASQEKHLSVVARENAMGGPTGTVAGRELWRVEVAVDDAGATLDELLPVLADAIAAHIDRAAPPHCVQRVARRSVGDSRVPSKE
jgi:hypothetical protein